MINIFKFKFNDNVRLGKYIHNNKGNNNRLFRQNHKKTYSLPQKIPINQPVHKCAPGHDYILILNKPANPLLCYYQSAIYKINTFPSVKDIATTDNMIVVINSEG